MTTKQSAASSAASEGQVMRGSTLTPDVLQAAVVALADGDLDGAECKRAFARILADADAADAPCERWAVALAALALGDAEAWAKASAAVAADVAAG